MNSFLNKKQFISLLVLLALILVLPLALLLTRQKQEVRTPAAGTGKIQVKLVPSNTTKQPGDTTPTTLIVTLTNNDTQARSIRVAGAEFKFDANTFDVSNINCGTTLSSSAFKDIVDSKIRLVCYVPGGTTGPSAPLVIAPGTSVNLGSFQVSLKEGVATGTYTFSSRPSDGGRTNIPEEGTLTDLSDEGAPATIVIGSEVTITPTPTEIPATPTPTPTGEVTPTPTTPPGECPDGDKGNLNCDSTGLINAQDFTILLASWSPEGPVPTPGLERHTADLNGDDRVNAQDFTIMLGNWRVE